MHSFSLITKYNSTVIFNNCKSAFIIVFVVFIIGIGITRSFYRTPKTARILLTSQKVQQVCVSPMLGGICRDESSSAVKRLAPG